jgi:hypothetical protein
MLRLLGILIISSISATSWAADCGSLLTILNFPMGRYLTFEGHAITGEAHWPLSQTIRNLGLEQSHLETLPLTTRILSVSEGTSDFIGSLRREGYSQAFALDPIYGATTFPDVVEGLILRNFINKNKDFLLTGTAENTGLGDKSFDLVVSHLFINNVTFNGNKYSGDSSVNELFRLIAPGGTLAIFGYMDIEVLKTLDSATWRAEEHAWKAPELKSYWAERLGDRALVEVLKPDPFDPWWKQYFLLRIVRSLH